MLIEAILPLLFVQRVKFPLRELFHLLGLALGSNGFDGLLDGLLVAKELHRHDWLEVLVQLVDEGYASGQVQSHDGVLREIWIEASRELEGINVVTMTWHLLSKCLTMPRRLLP